MHITMVIDHGQYLFCRNNQIYFNQLFTFSTVHSLLSVVFPSKLQSFNLKSKSGSEAGLRYLAAVANFRFLANTVWTTQEAVAAMNGEVIGEVAKGAE